MTKARYGMLAGFAGAAFAAAWWYRNRGSASSGAEFDGDVIFSNSPRVDAIPD